MYAKHSKQWVTDCLVACPTSCIARNGWLVLSTSSRYFREFQQAVMIDTMGQWLLIIVMLHFTEITYITYGLLGTGVGYLWIAHPCSLTCRVSHRHWEQVQSSLSTFQLALSTAVWKPQAKDSPTHYESPASPPSSEEAMPGLYTLYI